MDAHDFAQRVGYHASPPSLFCGIVWNCSNRSAKRSLPGRSSVRRGNWIG
jgi:hypothetical protein